MLIYTLVPGSSPGRCTYMKPLQSKPCKGFVVLGTVTVFFLKVVKCGRSYPGLGYILGCVFTYSILLHNIHSQVVISGGRMNYDHISTEKGTCPACGWPLAIIRSNFDPRSYSISCENCGLYSLTEKAKEYLGRASLLPDEGQTKLSHWIRKNQQTKENLKLTKKRVISIQTKSVLPELSEQCDILLFHLVKSLQSLSESINISVYELQSLVGAVGWQAARTVVARLWEKAYIDFSTGTRSGHGEIGEEFKLRLTIKGWYYFNSHVENSDVLQHAELTDTVIVFIRTSTFGEDNPFGFDRMIFEEEDKIINKLVKRHNGELSKEFGSMLMITYESVTDAIKCCIDIQNQEKVTFRSELKIGIHQGEVYLNNNLLLGGNMVISCLASRYSPTSGVAISEDVFNSIPTSSDVETTKMGTLNIDEMDRKIALYAITSNGLPAKD